MILFVVLLFLFITVVTLDAVKPYEKAQSSNVEIQKEVIVVDPGHGGSDPGKVASDGSMEKDLNLEIATTLASALRDRGYDVIMTRQADQMSLLERSKNADMRKRVEIANNSDACMMISIHQNSYEDEAVCGPQVFYYKTSQEAKDFAELLQQKLNEDLNITNPRTSKANADYYILKETSVLSVIVECGFLSNATETAKLKDKTYQEKIANCISDAVVSYEARKTQKRGDHDIRYEMDSD